MDKTQTPYILFNGLQADAIARLGDSSDVSLIALRREDSLGNVLDHNNGVLVAHVLYHSGEKCSFAISEMGTTNDWRTDRADLVV